MSVGCVISKKVYPKKQDFWPIINKLKPLYFVNTMNALNIDAKTMSFSKNGLQNWYSELKKICWFLTLKSDFESMTFWRTHIHCIQWLPLSFFAKNNLFHNLVHTINQKLWFFCDEFNSVLYNAKRNQSCPFLL